jgi:hypothetical protein
MKLPEFSRLGGLLKSSGLGAMAAAMAMTTLPAETMAQDGRGGWRANQGSTQVQRGGGGGWRGNEGATQRQGGASGNWQARAPRPQVQQRQPQMQQRQPQMQQRQQQAMQRPAQVQPRASQVRERWQDSRSSTLRQGGNAVRDRTPTQSGRIDGRRGDNDRNWSDRGERNWRDGDRNRGDRNWADRTDRNSRDGDRNRNDRNWGSRDDRNWRDGNRNWSNRGDRDWRDGRGDRYDRDHRRWSHRWRDDNRYDWRRHRSHHRHIYRIGRYYAPYHNHYYSRLRVGFFLGSGFYSNRYWIDDPWQYRLPAAYGPYKWIRYYDDALLVDIYTGEVVDVIHDFFW